MSQAKGFTLFELIITVSILAILATIAAPSMQNLIYSTQVKTATNKVMDIMQQARSDAIRTGRNVVVCASTDGTSCVTTSPTIWNVGILARDATGSAVYAVVDFNNADLTILESGNGIVTFNNTGAITGTKQISITKSGQDTYYVCIGVSGRVDKKQGTAC